MKKIILLSAIAVTAFAQLKPGEYAKIAAEPIGIEAMLGGPNKGAPYTATITTESIQVLADGNRIVKKMSANVARDSQGRMRQELLLGNLPGLSPEKMPRLVMITDPVAQESYTINLNEKTVSKRKLGPQKMLVTKDGTNSPDPQKLAAEQAALAAAKEKVRVNIRSREAGNMREESLGLKVIEGVPAEGFRSTRTIAAGADGNERPIEITNETWVSTDLKAIVYSKRSDPRTGDQIMQLTNIQRAEPPADLFTVPAGFRETNNEANAVIKFRTNE